MTKQPANPDGSMIAVADSRQPKARRAIGVATVQTRAVAKVTVAEEVPRLPGTATNMDVLNPMTRMTIRKRMKGAQGRRGSNGSSERSTQNRGRSETGGSSNSSQNRSGNRSVISRAVRVLNEIETRLHELREELQDEQGGSSSQSRGSSRVAPRRR